MVSNRNFLFLVLALLATFFQSSDAFAGLVGDDKAKGGDKEKADKGAEGDAVEGEEETDVDADPGFPLSLCNREDMNPILKAGCEFLVNYVQGAIQERIGGGDETGLTDDGLTDDGSRKLLRGPN